MSIVKHKEIFLENCPNYCPFSDSLYMAISAPTLDELVKPELKAKWDTIKHEWFPRTDTSEHAAFDRRTPGLFKEEWSGDGFVGLAAKTYYCYDKSDATQDKYSSKGLNKSIKLSREHFLNVLNTKQSSSHKNTGFIMKDKFMYTYEMERAGLGYFYCKRKVLDDGVSTTFLDI